MKEAPEFVYACPRRGTRHRLRRAGRAFVEFSLPGERHYRFALIDISADGLCFELENGQPILRSGSKIDHAVIRVGDTELSGSVSIAHVTRGFSAGTICGAKFRPATPFDESKLATLIESLTAGTK